ncbi:transcriptional regulator, partial [Klebsiella grimontii]|nr:transcriptional regulator [Klebsiella grimontii]
MEYKDPAFELLSNLEQIIFKDQAQAASLTRKPAASIEFDQLRKG